MAKGLNCQNCGHPMFAEREVEQEKGSIVYYKCMACKSTRKKFEDAPFNPYKKK